MLFKNAKLALLVTGFALMADAKKGKWGFRKKADDSSSEEISAETEEGFEADTFDAQKDSKNPDLDMDDDLFERLKKGKKKNKGQKGKKGKCNEKDFAKGVLNTISDVIGDREGEDTISLDELGAIFDAIVGEDFDPEDNRAYERGNDFADKKLYDQPGCRKECKMTPWAPECEACCVTYMHEVDWHCDSTDPENPPAACCTEWTEECYTKASDENKGHACADCGYGYGRSYGGYGGYRGRRRAGRGYGRGGRRRSGYGYGRGGRYGRGYGGYGGYSRGYGGYRG